MTDRLTGKVAFVTGATGDLGGATARRFAAEGALVAALDLKPPGVSWESAKITSFEVDVTDEASVDQAVKAAVGEIGEPDILVNCAGIIGRPAPSHEATVSEFDQIFDVNVKGVWLMTKYVVPHMIGRQKGSIVNFSSIHGLTGGSNVPLYHASKGAVRLLSKADAVTYGRYGIRVNSIHPGSMRTAMSQRSAEGSAVGPEEYYRQLVSGNPLPRQGEPDEIAYGVLYLASDESGFTTGSELVIDGGYTAH